MAILNFIIFQVCSLIPPSLVAAAAIGGCDEEFMISCPRYILLSWLLVNPLEIVLKYGFETYYITMI